MKRDLGPSNEELMIRVQRGDLAAFEALYDRYHKSLYHFIFRLVGEKPLAEDILQETFLRIFTKRKGYRISSSFSTYLFTIARNLCLDALKTWERRHILSNKEDIMERAIDLSKGPFQTLEETQTGETVQREIQKLPSDQREVLLLSKYSGLTYEEIGQIVGSTPAAVKQKVYRAMFSLKQKLKKLGE